MMNQAKFLEATRCTAVFSSNDAIDIGVFQPLTWMKSKHRAHGYEYNGSRSLQATRWESNIAGKSRFFFRESLRNWL